MSGMMHLVSLQQAGGVESQFAEFVLGAARRYPEWSQGWINPERGAHPYFRESLEQALTHRFCAKYRWNIKLPSKPDLLRAWHCGRQFAATGSDVAIIWNRTARTNFVLDAIGADNCIHWEHGAGWISGHERDRKRYLGRIPLVIANSRASGRVLNLLWGYDKEIRVCLNALRPSLMPLRPIEKSFPASRAIRLGVAARLNSGKGVALALHTLKLLRGQSMDVELHVAGDGDDRDRLNSLARQLGVSSVTHFHGSVLDMRSFYTEIDCLLHPSLFESFGLVTVEAAAHGCPVIATAVDGLPEAVMQGVSGYCIAPVLPLTEYFRLGGTRDSIPEYIYDPASDSMCEPRIVDPTEFAEQVCSLFSTAESYEQISRSASHHVLEKFQFDRHLDEVMEVVNGFAARRSQSGAVS
jgi:glycosyltransferase involved in cell wall biosynthesis